MVWSGRRTRTSFKWRASLPGSAQTVYGCSSPRTRREISSVCSDSRRAATDCEHGRDHGEVVATQAALARWPLPCRPSAPVRRADVGPDGGRDDGGAHAAPAGSDLGDDFVARSRRCLERYARGCNGWVRAALGAPGSDTPLAGRSRQIAGLSRDRSVGATDDYPFGDGVGCSKVGGTGWRSLATVL
jgi:hypothetical protein